MLNPSKNYSWQEKWKQIAPRYRKTTYWCDQRSFIVRKPLITKLRHNIINYGLSHTDYHLANQDWHKTSISIVTKHSDPCSNQHHYACYSEYCILAHWLIHKNRSKGHWYKSRCKTNTTHIHLDNRNIICSCQLSTCRR
jgi:hypothetical protein